MGQVHSTESPPQLGRLATHESCPEEVSTPRCTDVATIKSWEAEYPEESSGCSDETESISSIGDKSLRRDKKRRQRRMSHAVSNLSWLTQQDSSGDDLSGSSKELEDYKLILREKDSRIAELEEQLRKAKGEAKEKVDASTMTEFDCLRCRCLTDEFTCLAAAPGGEDEDILPDTYPTGSIVELHSLQSPEWRQYNGITGQVVGKAPRGRISVALNEPVLAMRACNLRVVSRPGEAASSERVMQYIKQQQALHDAEHRLQAPRPPTPPPSPNTCHAHHVCEGHAEFEVSLQRALLDADYVESEGTCTPSRSPTPAFAFPVSPCYSPHSFPISFGTEACFEC